MHSVRKIKTESVIVTHTPFQMHPVLRQMRSAAANANDEQHHSPPVLEGEGIARLNADNPDQHPRVQLKKESVESYPPTVNIIRDQPGEENEEMRDMRLCAGREIRINREHVLKDVDFEHDTRFGISPAKAHIQAADLLSAYEQTAKEEANFQKTFNNNVRTLISREEVTIGLMHLWDFAEAYLSNPGSKTLTAQLFLIVQHSRDDGLLKEALLNIAEPESKWLLDLLNILQTVIVQERSLSISEKVAAINYSVITLSKFYARKIYKSPFVPMDKEAKITTFYMRIVVKILILCDDLGWYRNERMERVVSGSRRRELNDRELFFCLRRALASSGKDEQGMSEFEYGDDLYPIREDDSEVYDEFEDEADNLALQRSRQDARFNPRSGVSVAEPPFVGHGMGRYH